MAEKKLTRKQEIFLEALCGEAKGNFRSAMRIAGYSDNTALHEVAGSLKNEIIERASMILALNAPKAALGIVDVMDDPTGLGARNMVSAAREVLDRTGLIKKEQVEVKAQEGGLFILPPKRVDRFEQETDDLEN